MGVKVTQRKRKRVECERVVETEIRERLREWLRGRERVREIGWGILISLFFVRI